MVIIGNGRIGSSLQARANEREVPCTVLGRLDPRDVLSGPQGDPILVATRNDDLGSVVDATPVHRRSDLVFLQNGAIRSFLNGRALGRSTRGLLFFAATERPGPLDEGLTNWFSGPHGPAVSRWFGQLGLEAMDVDWARFSGHELMKLLWLATLGPMCTALDKGVNEVGQDHRDELLALTAELASVGRAAMSVDLPADWLVDRIVAYSATLPGYKASVKEWSWRNGWLMEHALKHKLPTAVHRRWLDAAKVSY